MTKKPQTLQVVPEISVPETSYSPTSSFFQQKSLYALTEGKSDYMRVNQRKKEKKNRVTKH